LAVELGSLISEVKETIMLDSIADRVIAIDAYNTIYQFLTIIRRPDGTPLTDSNNMITSHLSGLFYRNINLLEHRIMPVYIFDGMPPALKTRTLEARSRRRDEALKEWGKALRKGMIEEARVHAVASSRITKEIVESAKQLLSYMGIAYIQAPSEGEAQAARMTREGLVYASASQDYDLFLYGANIVVRNLAITGRRKLPRKNVYIDVNPERIKLSKLLENLKINQRQLIWLGILMGTDYNSGIEGVGPKTALKIVKGKRSLKEIVENVRSKYGKEFDVDPFEVEEIFVNPETAEVKKSYVDSEVKNARVNKSMLTKFMSEEHGFSHERVKKFVDILAELKSKLGQKSIGAWV
jgi:flap endonuclease-1